MTARPKLTRGLLAVLSFLAATGPFATDMYLSSFTQIATDLGAPASSVQLTLTAFLFGMGFGQLVLGPLSDQWGRRGILLGALTVFALTSIAMVFSPTVEVLIGLRFLQGFAGAAGVVVSRAIAVDLTEGAAAIRAISLIAMFVGLGPLVAPPIGGAIAAVSDWRVVLATLAGLALTMVVLAALFVPESLPKERRNTAGLRSALGHFRALLSDPGFLLLMIVFALGFGGMMAYISASPFVGQVILGMPPFVYSLAFAAGAAAMVTANFINSRLAGKVPATRMLFLGTILAVLAGSGLTVLSATGALHPVTFILCAFLLTGGSGFIMSNASALALARARSAKGSGSALLGAGQFAVGGLASPIVGAWGEHTALPMAIFVLAAAVLACVGATLVHRSTPQ